MADVMIHIDEGIDHGRRLALVEAVRAQSGVSDATLHEEKPHLMLVQFNPGAVSAQALLKIVRDTGVHAELVGL